MDRKNKTFTDINENGGPYIQNDYNRLEQYLDQNLEVGDILVLSGSLPKECNLLIYKTWIEKYTIKGIRVILDCKGEVLKSCIHSKPYLIKPNQEELEELCGRKLDSQKDVIEEGRYLIRLGIEHVVISLGEKGAIYLAENIALYGEALQVKVKSTVGAGDAMVAAMCIAFENQLTIEEGFQLAIASASACIMCPGTRVATEKEVIELMSKVKLIKI